MPVSEERSDGLDTDVAHARQGLGERRARSPVALGAEASREVGRNCPPPFRSPPFDRKRPDHGRLVAFGDSAPFDSDVIAAGREGAESNLGVGGHDELARAGQRRTRRLRQTREHAECRDDERNVIVREQTHQRVEVHHSRLVPCPLEKPQPKLAVQRAPMGRQIWQCLTCVAFEGAAGVKAQAPAELGD